MPHRRHKAKFYIKLQTFIGRFKTSMNPFQAVGQRIICSFKIFI